jgi:hypothetical protein
MLTLNFLLHREQNAVKNNSRIQSERKTEQETVRTAEQETVKTTTVLNLTGKQGQQQNRKP